MGAHLVIGAGGGIGSDVVRRLVDDGHDVVAAGRSGDRLRELPDVARTVELDATDLDATRDVVRAIVNEHGRLDGVVNLAGSLLLKPAHLTTPDEWADTLATNLTTAFATVRAAAPAMRDHGGAIVLTASAAATFGLPNHDAIAAAKAGVVGLVRSAAATYGARGVRVNAVAPGMVDTPLTERLTSNSAQLEASRALHVLGRIGAPTDVGAAVAWLLSPDAAWITGQVLGVDGGLGSARTRS